ncbi:MAG TPA: biotin-dependent carboxyltransferase family protein [Tepidisphaeraceae bacterium]
MSIRIEQPGLLTTIQDLGRPTLRQAGLPGGGAVDPLALRTANLLVGNAEEAAAIECAWVGPVLRFTTAAILSVTGARVSNIPFAERFRVEAGTRLTLSRLNRGAYAYVAVAGGIDVPTVLGSRSTDVRLGFGGFEGRALRAGDELPIADAGAIAAAPGLRVGMIGRRDDNAPIRVVDGKDADRVSPDWLDQAFTVSSKSDRAGVRLEGTRIECQERGNDESSVVLPGVIQLPGDGRPIVLLADAQTLGGYPQIGHVIRTDLPCVAQSKPGTALRFERVSRQEAHRLALRQERELALMRYGLQCRSEAHA